MRFFPLFDWSDFPAAIVLIDYGCCCIVASVKGIPFNSSFQRLPINQTLCNKPCDWLGGWTCMSSFTYVPFPSLTLLKVSVINVVTVRTINQMEVTADGDDNDGDGD